MGFSRSSKKLNEPPPFHGGDVIPSSPEFLLQIFTFCPCGAYVIRNREIRDIFGVSDHFRCERHELYESWLLRLFKAGYKPFDPGDLSVELPPYCRYDVSEGLVRLDYNDTTIVAVMAFTT